MDWIPSPLHVLKTSAGIVYSVGDDEGEIKDVFLKPYVSDYGGPFNTLVTLPALNAPLQTWDIVIGKRPKGKLRFPHKRRRTEKAFGTRKTTLLGKHLV